MTSRYRYQKKRYRQLEKNMDIDLSSPVLVTGATGFVAGHIVKRLLEEGVTVHAAVRNPNDSDKLKYLSALTKKSRGKLLIFHGDLLEEGSYGDAMEGCSIVFHTASPFTLAVKDPQKELVDPALKGTRNVLEEVNRKDSVKRVVLTSSLVAMYGDNIDLIKVPNRTLTEKVWNKSSSLERNPYSFSKTVAEREAWEMVKKQSRWDLVVLNPSLVLGPGISPYSTSESYKIVKKIGDGTYKSGVVHWEFGAVDVRDLADAHMAAAYTPEASGRYIISGINTSLIELVELLGDRFRGNYPLPTRVLPKWLCWLVVPFLEKSITREYIAKNFGMPFKADNSKSKRELGITYRPLSESINEMFQQMVDSGIFNR